MPRLLVSLKYIGQLLGTLAAVFVFLYQMTKKSVDWPWLDEQNYFYIPLVLILISQALIVTYYIRVKDKKQLKNLLIFWVVFIGMFLFFYFLP